MAKTVKIYSSESLRRRTPLLVVMVVLLALAGVMQTVIDPERLKMQPDQSNLNPALGGLNNEFLLLPLLGFREAAAGLLWVRADEFFHSGDYDAILPLVRLITWLDPHADNVYTTGAWHLAYNFTDANERSDRRYIAPAEALLDEGIRNNPNIPDIKFEKGWQCYDKIHDFNAAEAAYLLAIRGPNENGRVKDINLETYPYACPLKTLHMLAHTYEKQGRIPEALAEWQAALDRSEEIMSKNSGLPAFDGKPEFRYDGKDNPLALKQLRDAELHNYAELLIRYHDRYTTRRDANSVNKDLTNPAVLKPDVTGATPRPWDVAIHTNVEVVRPKVFKLSGNFNSGDGARIDIRITDWNYQPADALKEVRALEPPDTSQTILIDSISVRKGTFEREMDMSKDPKMYSFSNKDDLYKVVFTFNPRTTSPTLHDRFGWSGEGLTNADPKFIYMIPNVLKNDYTGTKLIEWQGGIGPVWDGKTIPWPRHGQPLGAGREIHVMDKAKMMVNGGMQEQEVVLCSLMQGAGIPPTGQPPRAIRVTYKVTKAQVLNQKPITDKDIVPNDDTTPALLK
jgi:tetratricopeptide (TPR) repeat protein